MSTVQKMARRATRDRSKVGSRIAMAGVSIISLVTVGAVVGVEAGATSTSTTYYACLKSGALSSVGTVAPRCTSPAKVISWNSKGVQGLAGPKGATGAAGPVGATGPQGLVGPAGAPGTNGPALLNGNACSFPDSSVGNLGDTFLDTCTGNIYLKDPSVGWEPEGSTQHASYSYGSSSPVHFTAAEFDVTSIGFIPNPYGTFEVTATGTLADRSLTGWGQVHCDLQAQFPGYSVSTLGGFDHAGTEASGPGGAYPTSSFAITGSLPLAGATGAGVTLGLACTQIGDSDQIISNVLYTVSY